MELLTKIANFILYGKWTACRHTWYPVEFADWQCTACEAKR